MVHSHSDHFVVPFAKTHKQTECKKTDEQPGAYLCLYSGKACGGAYYKAYGNGNYIYEGKIFQDEAVKNLQDAVSE